MESGYNHIADELSTHHVLTPIMIATAGIFRAGTENLLTHQNRVDLAGLYADDNTLADVLTRMDAASSEAPVSWEVSVLDCMEIADLEHGDLDDRHL